MKKIIETKNRNKTIEEILDECNLLGNKQYLVNPSLLIGIFYGTFLLNYEKIGNNSNEISEIFNRHFTVIKNENHKNILNAIRNSLAHYNIDMVNEKGIYFYIFGDKYPKQTDYHFQAKISTLGLRLVLKELGELM